MDYQKICSQVQGIAREAGNFILGEKKKIRASDVETKSNASFVTYVDKTAESMIVEKLRKIFPDAGFVTEEGTARSSGEENIWYIDPLDGTTNYIHGIFPNSVSIALSEKGKLVTGVVYELGLDEMFYAWAGGKAYLNGREIRVSESFHSFESLIGTGFPYDFSDRIVNYINVMDELMKKSRGLRRLGSAAADLSYVAAGRFEAFFEYDLYPWDVAAGAFIIQQAGGTVTDFNGGENWLSGGEIIASGANYFHEFYEIVHRHLGKK